jgi:hypothetical protein
MLGSLIRWDFPIDPQTNMVSFITDAPADMPAITPPEVDFAGHFFGRRVANPARDAQLAPLVKKMPAAPERLSWVLPDRAKRSDGRLGSVEIARLLMTGDRGDQQSTVAQGLATSVRISRSPVLSS